MSQSSNETIRERNHEWALSSPMAAREHPGSTLTDIRRGVPSRKTNPSSRLSKQWSKA
jgi:hypothetical protein